MHNEPQDLVRFLIFLLAFEIAQSSNIYICYRSQALSAMKLLVSRDETAQKHRDWAATLLHSKIRRASNRDAAPVCHTQRRSHCHKLATAASSGGRSRGSSGWATKEIEANATTEAASKAVKACNPKVAKCIPVPAHRGWSPSCSSLAHPRGLHWIQRTWPSTDNPKQRELERGAGR